MINMLCEGCHVFKTWEIWMIVLGSFIGGALFMVIALITGSMMDDEPQEINIAEERLRQNKLKAEQAEEKLGGYKK